jgi:hypothetical protein
LLETFSAEAEIHRVITRNVKMEERRKHHHLRSMRHSSSDRTGFSVGIDVSGVAMVDTVDMATKKIGFRTRKGRSGCSALSELPSDRRVVVVAERHSDNVAEASHDGRRDRYLATWKIKLRRSIGAKFWKTFLFKPQTG